MRMRSSWNICIHIFPTSSVAFGGAEDLQAFKGGVSVDIHVQS
jgi:hypothetical protein